MAWDTSQLQDAEAEFPYRGRHVMLLAIGADGRVLQARKLADKRRVLGDAGPDDLVLALRPGPVFEFLVADPAAARAALQ